MPLASDQPELAQFSFGLQSVINRHQISAADASQQQSTLYESQMDELNKLDGDSDVFCIRFSLNSSQSESPFLNHRAHRLRKHLARKIMDCPLPRDIFKYDDVAAKDLSLVKMDENDDELFLSHSASSNGDHCKSDYLSSSDALDEGICDERDYQDGWRKLEIQWLADSITFTIDGKVYREFK